ncbi:MAG: Crp/Fnr family transcriptional regulator [Phenylobacterium sp.]|nr:Crp/Fnr family transcriptional regulator [Phenylobacterium sp.]
MRAIGDFEEMAVPLEAPSSANAPGKLSELLLKDRAVTTFEKDQVIYDAPERTPTLFFVRSGFVKVGAIMEDGHELIYDLRTRGDVVGELCASNHRRQDRAVALVTSEIVATPYEEVLAAAQRDRGLMREFVEMFCDPLSDTYGQLSAVAHGDVVTRLARVLRRLAAKIGRPVGAYTELPVHLTQETIAQMVAMRRERVSWTMNRLRRRGVLDYSRGGYIVLDLDALSAYSS